MKDIKDNSKSDSKEELFEHIFLKSIKEIDQREQEKENKQEIEEKQKKDKTEQKNKKDSKMNKNNKKILIPIGVFSILMISTIGIFISLKMNFVKVPNLVGMTSLSALEKLEENNLIENIIEKEVSEEDIGKVISQSQADDYVKKNTTIDITIGISSKKIKMINLKNLSEEEAIEKINQLGLNIKITETYDNEIKTGYVVYQSIKENEEISKGSIIEVAISKGKKTENKSKEWSSWSEKLPSNVTSKNYVIETKKQYRKRDKSTTTSTNSTMNGWTKYDEETTYGSWGSNKTTYSKVTANDTTQIISTKKEWVYFHEVNQYSDGSYGIDSIPYHNHRMTCSFTSSTELPLYAYNQDKGGKVMYSTVWKCGDCGFSGWFLKEVKTKTTYQTRTKTTTYYFYKWSDWSNWSNNKIIENDNHEVETKVLYRYKEK